jgi:hypothetical protein
VTKIISIMQSFPHALNYKRLYQTFRSRDSSVGIALGYGLDDLGSRVRFPAEAGNFSLHHRVQNGSGAYPASYPMGTRGSCPGGKAARSKNERSYTSTPSTRLHGVVLILKRRRSDNFTFTILNVYI